MTLRLKIDGERACMGVGETRSSIPAEVYRDAPKSLLSSLVDRVCTGVDWQELIEQEVRPFNAWLADIISSPKRNAFLRLLDGLYEGALGLDVGAGWGQHTVEMAKKCAICSVEPSPERFQFLQAICRQESVSQNCYFINAGLNQLEFDRIFDFAVCIGVLEWVGKFEACSKPWDAQLQFLSTIRRSLKKGAPLVVGIENRLGLKYLLGSNDDHIGLPHILCMDYENANKYWQELKSEELKVATYSMREYERLFQEAGFGDLVFHAALPDYKMPTRILECSPNDLFSRFLAEGGFIDEYDGSNGSDHGLNRQLRSVYASLGEEGIAPLFAPSYFIVARSLP